MVSGGLISCFKRLADLSAVLAQPCSIDCPYAFCRLDEIHRHDSTDLPCAGFALDLLFECYVYVAEYFRADIEGRGALATDRSAAADISSEAVHAGILADERESVSVVKDNVFSDEL